MSQECFLLNSIHKDDVMPKPGNKPDVNAAVTYIQTFIFSLYTQVNMIERRGLPCCSATTADFLTNYPPFRVTGESAAVQRHLQAASPVSSSAPNNLHVIDSRFI